MPACLKELSPLYIGRPVVLYRHSVILSSTSCRSFSTFRALRPCAAALTYAIYLASISPRALLIDVIYVPGLSAACEKTAKEEKSRPIIRGRVTSLGLI